MKIVSWNVNGLRAVVSKNFNDWVHNLKPDIIALQEIKAHHSDVQHLFQHWDSEYNTHLFPAEKKGYSGTALLIKKKLSPLITLGINSEKFDCEGRLITAEFDDFILMNGYFPNGQRDHNRVPYKLEFSKLVLKKALELKKKTKKEILITGDFNTAHHEIDLANPKSNIDSTGFLPIERKFLDELTKKNFVDVFRYFYPHKAEQYTWWTYRSGCRERNIGWRLDYFFSSADFIQKIKTINHQTEILGSDHCPVVLELRE
jgi:exodeoxyribonuclease-3